MLFPQKFSEFFIVVVYCPISVNTFGFLPFVEHLLKHKF
jgi:hypothetical protein